MSEVCAGAVKSGPEAQVPLPEAIGGRIALLRGALRRHATAFGATRLIIAVVGYVAGTFMLDRALDLPPGFRLVLLVLGLGLLGWVALRSLVRPLFRPITDEEVALLLERRFPLKDELISAVQLARPSADVALFHSRALVRTVIEEAAERVSRLDFDRVIESRALKRVAALAALASLLVAALFASQPKQGRIWFERCVLLRPTPWPRTVELAISFEPADRVVALGDDLVVAAEVLSGAPSRVVAHAAFAGAAEPGEVAMLQARGTWRTVFENVMAPFRLRVEAGDFRSDWFEVQVRPRPRLERLSIALEYPAYTGLARPDRPLEDGNLKVPTATRVLYSAYASEPLRWCEVGFDKPQAVEVERPATLNPPTAPERREIEGAFVVRDSTAWSFRLVSRDGFESPAAQFQIRAIPDRIPEARIVRPGRNKEATRGAVFSLEVELRDDYGLRAADLVYSVEPSKARSGSPAVETRVPLGRARPGAAPPEAGATFASFEGARQATLTHALELSSMPLEPGDRVTYWVEVVDARAPRSETTSLAAESRGRSAKYRLQIVSQEECLRALQGRLRRLRDDLQAVARSQKAARDDLEALSGELERRGEPSARDRQRIATAELDQRRIAQRLERACAEFGEVREEMASNGAGKPDDLSWLAELEAAARSIATGKAARVVSLLEGLRQAARPGRRALAEVVSLQAEIAEAVGDLVRRLEKWDEFNEVLRDVRELIQIQERIHKETQERLKAELR